MFEVGMRLFLREIQPPAVGPADASRHPQRSVRLAHEGPGILVRDRPGLTYVR